MLLQADRIAPCGIIDIMKCDICNKEHSNKRFCSKECKHIWFVDNNRLNNPIHNPVNLEKMRKSLTGKKQSEATKSKRAEKLKIYYANNPEAKARLAKNVWDKYTSRIAGTGWAKVRLKALERDSYTCQLCGEQDSKKLMVHHIDWQGKRRGISMTEWNNKLGNLQTLCHKCHNGIHRHKSSDYKKRYSDVIAP